MHVFICEKGSLQTTAVGNNFTHTHTHTVSYLGMQCIELAVPPEQVPMVLLRENVYLVQLSLKKAKRQCSRDVFEI